MSSEFLTEFRADVLHWFPLLEFLIVVAVQPKNLRFLFFRGPRASLVTLRYLAGSYSFLLDSDGLGDYDMNLYSHSKSVPSF